MVLSVLYARLRLSHREGILGPRLVGCRSGGAGSRVTRGDNGVVEINLALMFLAVLIPRGRGTPGPATLQLLGAIHLMTTLKRKDTGRVAVAHLNVERGNQRMSVIPEYLCRTDESEVLRTCVRLGLLTYQGTSHLRA